MSLTVIRCRNAKPGEKPVKLFDGGGLYLLANPSGSRWGRFDYRYADKRRTLSMGVYPKVSLTEARARRDAARKQLAAGIDPGLARKAERSAGAESFEAVAREWHAKRAPGWAPGPPHVRAPRRATQGGMDRPTGAPGSLELMSFSSCAFSLR